MTEGIKVKVQSDYEGARQKTETVRRIPRAFLWNANRWASNTVRYIKQSYKGGRVFKRPPKDIDDRLDYKVTSLGQTSAEILIGTGAHIGRPEVVYARIQEEGGWIVPKKAKALTIPFPNVKHRAAAYRPVSFIIDVKGKNTGVTRGVIVMKAGKRGRLVPLFLLRTSVKLPARHWFSRPIAERIPLLNEMMSDEGVLATASQMAYKRTPSQGGA